VGAGRGWLPLQRAPGVLVPSSCYGWEVALVAPACVGPFVLPRVGLIPGGTLQKGLAAGQGGSLREAPLRELPVVQFSRGDAFLGVLRSCACFSGVPSNGFVLLGL
jgi:hypothetical protein